MDREAHIYATSFVVTGSRLVTCEADGKELERGNNHYVKLTINLRLAAMFKIFESNFDQKS